MHIKYFINDFYNEHVNYNILNVYLNLDFKLISCIPYFLIWLLENFILHVSLKLCFSLKDSTASSVICVFDLFSYFWGECVYHWQPVEP